MKKIVLILALCINLPAFSQTTGGGTTAGGGTGGTGGTASGAAAGDGGNTIYGSGSGSPAVNTVGNPLNQYQSGTLPGSPSRAGMAPVRPGLPGSPATTTTTGTTPPGGSVTFPAGGSGGTLDTSQASSGFTNQFGSTQGTNNLANNNIPSAFRGAGLDSTELQEMLSVLRNNIQQILPGLESYNRTFLSGGTAGVGRPATGVGNTMEMNAGAGGASVMSGTGTGSGQRAGSTGSGANLSTSSAGNFSRDTSGNAGANVSTPAGGSITGNRGSATGSAAGGGATVSGGSGSAASTTASDPNNLMTTSRGGVSGRLSPTGASDPYSGYSISSSGTGTPGMTGAKPETESMLLLEADLRRTLALLNSLNVPDLASGTSATGMASSPQGTIRGVGSRVQPGAVLRSGPRQSTTTSTPVTTPPAGVNR